MRLALYARCSTTEQNVDSQLDALRNYATARQAEAVDEYIDLGISGSKDRRPALDELMSKARRRCFDAVVVVKLDRLGRSLHHLLTVLGEFEELGIDFVSLDDGLDTSTAVGRLFMQMRGAFAEYERSLIAERTEAGRAAARRRGVRFGRPRRLSDEEEARIRRLRASGHSIRAIAEQLGVSKSLVSKELSTKSLSRNGTEPSVSARNLDSGTPTRSCP